MSIPLSALLAQCAPEVAPSTLAAVVSVESKSNPLAIGVNRGRQVRQPANAAEAVAVAKGLLAHGVNFDLGLGQVNSANLRRLGLSVEDAFDPCRNLAAAAQVLTDNYRRAVSLGHPTPLGAALSAYNTGSMQRGYRNGYVARVYGASGTLLPASPAPVIAASPPVQPATLAAAVPVTVVIPARPAPPAWDVFAQSSTARVFPSNFKGSN